MPKLERKSDQWLNQITAGEKFKQEDNLAEAIESVGDSREDPKTANLNWLPPHYTAMI